MIYKQVLCFIFILFFLPHSFAITKIATSLPILTIITQEIAKDIAGGEIEIQTLPFSGGSAHHFELSPKTLLELSKKDFIIINGLRLEESLIKLKENSLFSKKIIEATEGITPLSNKANKADPHAWHDPNNLLKYVDNISKALVNHNPEKRSLYEKKSNAIKEKLIQWKNEKKQLMNQIQKSPLIITSHDGFIYFTNFYNLKNMNLIDDHHAESLTPKELTQKLNQLKEFKHRVFFGDGTKNDEFLKKLCLSTKSQWGGVLWSESLPQPPPATIIEYLNQNFNTLWNSINKVTGQSE